MKPNLRASQCALLSIFVIWFIVLVQTTFYLPTVGEDLPSPIKEFFDREDSTTRRRQDSKDETYGIDGNYGNRNIYNDEHDNGSTEGGESNPRERYERGRAMMQDSRSDTIIDSEYHTISNHSRNALKRRYARKAIKKRTIARPTLLLPTPIIIMGFPKAGTSSIFSFFQKQGLRSQHWYCCEEQTSPQRGGPILMADCLLHNLKQNSSAKTMFHGCGYYDVYAEINGPRRERQNPALPGKKGYVQDDGSTDYGGPGRRLFFPQHFRIQEIHDSFPNATWILNWRDFDSWIKSVFKWGTNDHLHQQFLNEYYMQGSLPPTYNGSAVIPDLFENRTIVKELLRTVYFDHFEMVRDFVRKHPSHALVEVNITHENASAILATTFGLSRQAWKHVNKNTGRKRNDPFLFLPTKRTFLVGALDVRNTSLWWILVLLPALYFAWSLGIEILT